MIMKYLVSTLFLYFFLMTKTVFAFDFEVEILSASPDLYVFELPDVLTYRQFNIRANWKDNLGDWGVLECAGTHTIFKNNKGTILKNYCKGSNTEGDIFWLIMDRKSNDFDAGIGKIEYVKGNGKFEKYLGTKCVYAVSHLPEGKGSFIKTKCTFKKKKN